MKRPAQIMLQLTVDTDGVAFLQKARAMSPGMAGLYLADLAAKHCTAHPSTPGDRMAYERARQLMTERDPGPHG